MKSYENIKECRPCNRNRREFSLEVWVGDEFQGLLFFTDKLRAGRFISAQAG